MIVSDSSPLILLSKINKIDILKQLYEEIYIPKAVYEEVIVAGKEERYGDAFALEKKIGDMLFVKELDKKIEKEMEQLGYLGKGEAESILLCKQLKAKTLLIDDWKSRKVAEMLEIECKSTLGILLEALKKDVFNLEVYEQTIKELAKHAWLSGEIVAEFLQAGRRTRGDKNEAGKG